MSATLPPTQSKRGRSGRLLAVALVGLGVLLVALVLGRRFLPFDWPWAGAAVPPPVGALDLGDPAVRLAEGRRLNVWWDALSPRARAQSVRTGDTSNIHPADYAGPDACKGCHATNYQAWERHPHRWMNALAGEATVTGDFSG